MVIDENVPLAQYTTFKIGGPAKYFCHVKTEEGLIEAVKMAKEKNLPIFILGGGSNLLVSDSGYSGVVLKIEMTGKQYRQEGDDVYVTAAAGELWDELIADVVDRGLYGIENLSAIPGTVGATPVQNIGAYGCDVSTSISKVRALDTETMNFVDLSNADCKFEYRDSMFKHNKGKYVITAVEFHLTRNGKVNVDYRDLKDYFSAKGIQNPTLRQVRDAVIEIRWAKLPDWKLWGTAGSYFKNPVITPEHFKELKKKYPDLPGYAEPNGNVKVSLGWILDKVCNAKEINATGAKTYEKQALVVVAQPGSSSSDVVSFAHNLMKVVKEKTGIEIEAEVEWVN